MATKKVGVGVGVELASETQFLVEKYKVAPEAAKQFLREHVVGKVAQNALKRAVVEAVCYAIKGGLSAYKACDVLEQVTMDTQDGEYGGHDEEYGVDDF